MTHPIVFTKLPNTLGWYVKWHHLDKKVFFDLLKSNHEKTREYKALIKHASEGNKYTLEKIHVIERRGNPTFNRRKRKKRNYVQCTVLDTGLPRYDHCARCSVLSAVYHERAAFDARGNFLCSGCNTAAWGGVYREKKK